ncbi:MAG: hypothetical protein AB7O39_01090 [Flavobacteriaceae bacterium]
MRDAIVGAASNPHGQRIFAAVLCAAAFAFAVSAVAQPLSDGYYRYETFRTLFAGGPVAFVKYSTVQPLLARLLDLPLRAAFPGLAENAVPRFFELLLIVAAMIGCLFASRDWRRPALVAGLVPLSMLVHYLGQFYAEITTAALMALGFALFHRARSRAALLVAAFIGALGIANTYVLIGPLCATAALAAFRLWRGREDSPRLLCFLLAVLAMAGAAILADLLIKGELLDNPYASARETGFRTLLPYSGLPGFSYPVLLGLLGSIFSFGKSIFLFNPFLIFLFICDYRYKPYALTFLLAALLIYSGWWAWYGGYSFGTRFYIFAIIPSLFVFVDALQRPGAGGRRWLEPAALLGAIWVAICGKYFGLEGLAAVCQADRYALEAFCWYVPEFTPLIHPLVAHGLFGALGHVHWADWIYITLVLVAFGWVRLLTPTSRMQQVVARSRPHSRSAPAP